MSRDFTAELASFCKDLTKAQPKATPEKKASPERLYNIHKRSLPPSLDKIVAMQFTKKDAKWMIEKRLKAKELIDGEKISIIYYDIIPCDASSDERSFYFNTKPVITE